MKYLRSIASVLVTYCLVFPIVQLGETVLAHFYPTYVPGQLPTSVTIIWINTAVYALASLLSGWLCVLLAPTKPRLHLLALFILGESMGIFFTIAFWHTHPHWVSLIWLAVWPAALWFGGYRTIHD